MFDRSGEFSPTNDEREVEKESPKTSLLTEAAYLANAKEDSDQTKDVVSGISEIAFVLKSTTFDTKVANFKSGITNPLLDFMMMQRQEEKDIGTRRHKENAIYLSSIRREIERSSSRSTKAVTGSLRETYYGMTKSVFSAIGTVMTPVAKLLTVGLFGSKKERTVVEAVDEQTQFLRSGRILDSSTIFSRFMRRGVLGNVAAGAAGAAGIGRGAAQSAENKRGNGEQLNFREKLVTTMGVQLGWFKQFDRRDTKKTFDKNNPEQEQTSVLDRIRLGVESFLEFFRHVSEIQINELGELRYIAGSQTNVLKEAIQISNLKAAERLESSIQTSGFRVADRVEAANDASSVVYQNAARAAGDGLQNAIHASSSGVAEKVESANNASMSMYQNVARTANNNLSYFSHRQNSILSDVKDEVTEANKPTTSAYEQKALFIQNAQYEELQKANELVAAQKEAAANEANKSSGGGLIGMAMSLGGLIFNKKSAAVFGGLASKYLTGPLKRGIMKGGSKFASLGKRFIISPVMGAIKAGGSWLMKNGFKLLLRAPFAKIFTVVAVAGLLYKYLARPMIDWFDNKFNTDIGGAIDRFGNMISDKFFGILDWIREKMASVPVIGKYFEKDDPVPKVPESQKKTKKEKDEEGGFFSPITNLFGGDDKKTEPAKSFSETYRPEMNIERNGGDRNIVGDVKNYAVESVRKLVEGVTNTDVINTVKNYATESLQKITQSISSGNVVGDVANYASDTMNNIVNSPTNATNIVSGVTKNTTNKDATSYTTNKDASYANNNTASTINTDIVDKAQNSTSDYTNQVIEGGSRIVNWYGNQWSEIGEMGKEVLVNLTSVASDRMGEVTQKGADFVQSGIDRIKGYEPDGIQNFNRREASTAQMGQNALASTINPVMDQSPTITDDMTMAALESRDAMLQQVNELKEQRKAMEQQNQRMIDIMSSVAGNTHQGVMATFMATKSNQNAIKNQNALNVNGFD